MSCKDKSTWPICKWVSEGESGKVHLDLFSHTLSCTPQTISYPLTCSYTHTLPHKHTYSYIHTLSYPHTLSYHHTYSYTHIYTLKLSLIITPSHITTHSHPPCSCRRPYESDGRTTSYPHSLAYPLIPSHITPSTSYPHPLTHPHTLSSTISLHTLAYPLIPSPHTPTLHVLAGGPMNQMGGQPHTLIPSHPLTPSPPLTPSHTLTKPSHPLCSCRRPYESDGRTTSYPHPSHTLSSTISLHTLSSTIFSHTLPPHHTLAGGPMNQMGGQPMVGQMAGQMAGPPMMTQV